MSGHDSNINMSYYHRPGCVTSSLLRACGLSAWLSDNCLCLCQGISSIVSYVHNKQRHPRVIWINLRDDVTIQCDHVTYSVRDTAQLDEPVLLPAATRSDVEVPPSLCLSLVQVDRKPTLSISCQNITLLQCCFIVNLDNFGLT